MYNIWICELSLPDGFKMANIQIYFLCTSDIRAQLMLNFLSNILHEMLVSNKITQTPLL